MIENFPKKCIKCKRTDVDLIGYRVIVSKTKGYKHQTTRTKTYQVPICEDCRSLLKKHDNIALLGRCIGIVTIIIFVFSIVPLILKKNFLIPILIIGVVFLVITIVLFINKSNSPHNIKKYIEPRLDGTIFDDIKDPEYKKEMINFLKAKVVVEAINKELGMNIIYCPRCGSKQNKDADFCLDCGKDLRTPN